MNMVRGELRKAITNQNGYKAFTRTDIDRLMKEHGFQNSGMVSDDQRKQLGKMSGADYICVSTLTKSNTQFYLEAYLIEVETGEISNPATQYGMLKDGTYANLFQLCQDLAQELIGYVGGSGGGNSYTPFPPSGGNVTAQRWQDFIETAFGINMKMVYVEGGTFTMGCTGDQGNECESDESPNRMTTVSSFYIGMLEVTQSQWEKVMGTSIYQQQSKAGGSNTYGVGSDYPMYYVSWEEAKEFCARLSRQTGRNYSLPTEAEWEYAARGGKRNEGTKYAGGWSIDDVAWYDGNSNSSTHMCGTKRSNALGIYDMSGNVWEWCEDWYGSQYLQYDNNNPKGASTGSNRVLRGGSWRSFAGSCRVANRDIGSPGHRRYNFGFRIVLH
jgi:formylglycine-generating enzyme required for sulfatase activity